MSTINLLLCCVIALGVALVAGYATFTFPMWALGASAESSLLWGWITGLAAMVVSAVVAVGVFVALRRLLEP